MKDKTHKFNFAVVISSILAQFTNFRLFSCRCILNLHGTVKFCFSNNRACVHKFTSDVFQQSFRNFCPIVVRNEKNSIRKLHGRNILQEACGGTYVKAHCVPHSGIRLMH